MRHPKRFRQAHGSYWSSGIILNRITWFSTGGVPGAEATYPAKDAVNTQGQVTHWPE